jgi:hypothetical protein
MKAKGGNLSAAMLLFHNFYENYLDKSYIFFESLLLPHHFKILNSVENVLRYFPCILLLVSTDSWKIRTVGQAVVHDGKPLVLNFIKEFE